MFTRHFLLTLLCLSQCTQIGFAFPSDPAVYRSLAGLSSAQVDALAKTFERTPGAQPPPAPQTNTSAKLVNDAAHPYRAPRKGDIRGPCPALNALANHGYLDRSGIATPGEIVDACQIGFNMKNDLAVFFSYAAFMVDGNHLTNLMSIGAKTVHTGLQGAPPTASIGGLNFHGHCEGDSSITRDDFYWVDNFSYNETLFQQLIKVSNEISPGILNVESSSQARWNRIQDSMARNPTFNFRSPRFVTAYGESVLPLAFWKNITTGVLNLDDARTFYEHGRFPVNFWRREGEHGNAEQNAGILEIWNLHPTLPGGNNGTGNYIVDPNDEGAAAKTPCTVYHKVVRDTIPGLYPNPTGDLLNALKMNMDTLYHSLGDDQCLEIHPYA